MARGYDAHVEVDQVLGRHLLDKGGFHLYVNLSNPKPSHDLQYPRFGQHLSKAEVDERRLRSICKDEQGASIACARGGEGMGKGSDVYEDSGNGQNIKLHPFRTSQVLFQATWMVARLFGSKQSGRGSWPHSNEHLVSHLNKWM